MQKQDLHKQVALAQSGNEKALEIVCRELQGEVKSTISKIIEDPVLVEDLSQETYIRLLTSFQNIKEPIKIKNFVAKIALCVINDHFRKQYKWKNVIVRGKGKQEQSVIIRGNNSQNVDNEDNILNKITFEEAIDIIPDHIDKQLIKLKAEGKSYKEISYELDITEGSAKMRFKRAMHYLRNKLKE